MDSWASLILRIYFAGRNFTALYTVQGGISHERHPSVRPSVCPSVRLFVSPSVCQTWILTIREKLLSTFIPHERPIIVAFWHEEWLVGMPLSTWNFGPNWPVPAQNADFLKSFFAHSTSAVTHSEKVLLPLKAVNWVLSSFHWSYEHT